MGCRSQQVWGLTQPQASRPEPQGATRLLLLWLWWRGVHTLPPSSPGTAWWRNSVQELERLYIRLMHQGRAIGPKQVSTTALGSEDAEHPKGSEETELRKYTEWKSRAVKALEEKLRECGERV